MRFLLLGPLEVRGERGVVALGGTRPRAVLAMLLLHANEPVSAERLALALWGQDAPAGAQKTVQVHVSRLRTALGDRDVIETTTAGYRLRVRPEELDVAWFEQLVEDGRRALAADHPEQAAALLREALGLWRGPALTELPYDPFAGGQIARLEEQRVAALEARVEADLAAGRHAELVGELRQLVAEHPTRERLAAHLMLALYRCARQADALEVYQDARRMLVTEVGIEPGAQLRELQDAILHHDIGLNPRSVAPESSTELDAEPLSANGSAVVPVFAEPVVLTLPRAVLRSATSGPFVGRDTELARLREHWTEVQAGARSAVVIAGEPGIGKTRLASELACEVHEVGTLVLYGRCDEGLAVPYQPFIEALQPYVRAVGTDRLRAELGDLAPQLGRLLPEFAGLGEPARADPESERFALFEAIAALLEAMTREQHALLIVDDLHWAARPTLLLLRHLIRCDRPLRLLTVASYRDTELNRSHPLGQLLADLHRDASADHLRIGALGEPAIAALLKATLGHPLNQRASELVPLLEDQTAGNPFFIRELLANLADSGTIFAAGARMSASLTQPQLDVPEGLRHVISQRVARLAAPARRALCVAAAAGPTFSFVLLERVLCESEEVLDALEQAVAAGLLTDAGQDQYDFAHTLVRQTIYRQLGSARRMRLHRQLGEALEALDDIDAHVEALAYHFAQAAADGQADKAADYALAAGRKAIARLGYEEAAAHCERGLDVLALSPQSHEQRRCELLLALGGARWGAGESERARHAYWEAAELADRLGDATVLAAAALGFGGPYRIEVVIKMHQPITGLLERALAALGEGDSPQRAQLLGRLAARMDDRTPALAREALRMARRVADKATLADVLNSCFWATRDPDALHESLAIARELRGVAAELGQGRLEAVARGWLVDLLLELGDINGVEGELKALQRFTETRKDRYVASLLASRQAGHALLCGRLEDCETLAHDVLAHPFEGPEVTAMIFVAQMSFVRDLQGRLDELMEDLEEVGEKYADPEAGWRCALAYFYAQLGRTAQARQELDLLARADFEDLPRGAFWLSSLSALSGVVVILADVARAGPLYTMLLPYADRCVVAAPALCSGSASRALGLLATTLSRYDEAERHFEHALTMNAQIKSPLWVAYTQHDFARMLLLRNHAGDRDTALQLLTELLITTRQLGLTGLADKARPLKLAAEAIKQSPAL